MPTDPQDQITKFWSMVAPGYEAHGGNVAEHGTAEHRRWLDAVDGSSTRSLLKQCGPPVDPTPCVVGV